MILGIGGQITFFYCSKQEEIPNLERWMALAPSWLNNSFDGISK